MYGSEPRSRWQAAAGLAPALIAIAALLLAWVRDFDSDLFWHIAAGELVLRDAAVRIDDVFSWTAAGEPFINHEWLAGVGAALVARLGGLELIVLLKAVVAGGVWLLLAGASRDRGARPLPVAFALLWALVLARFRLLAKPEVLSLALVVVFDRLSESWLRHGRRRSLFWLVALAGLWGNLHLLVVLGLVVMGAHAVGEWLGRLLGLADCQGRGRPELLLAAVAAGFLATLVNPYGLRVYEPVLAIYRTPAIVAAAVREWAPPTVADFGPFYLLAPLATLVILATSRRLRPQDALLWLGMMAMAFRSLRHIGAFAVVAAPILARHLSLASERLRPSWRTPPLGLGLVGAGTLALCWTLLSPHASFWHQDQSRFFRFGLSLAPGAAPVETTALVTAAGLGGPVFNSWELGGYLIWKSWPQIRVFLDGRHYVYERFLGWLQARPPAQALRELDIPIAFVSYRDLAWLQAFRADGRYRTLFFDDAAIVLLRQDRLRQSPELLPYTRLHPEALESADAETLAETERGVAQSPQSVRAWLLRGASLRRSQQPREAVVAYRRALELDPRQASGWNNLGLALLEDEGAREARACFRKALRLDPTLAAARANLELTGGAR